MNFDISLAFENIRTLIISLLGNFLQPWTFIQLGLIGALFVISLYLSKLIEPPVEAKARLLKVSKGTMRLVIALLRRFEWILFVLFSWIAFSILRATAWTSHSYLVSIALEMASAWLTISVLSHVIRSRTIAKAVAVIGWSIVALSIIGWLDNVQDFLDAAAFTIGNFRLSALRVIQGVGLIIGLLWLATATGNYADRQIADIPDLAPSLKVLLGKIIKISLVIAALAISFASVGIDLTALTVFSGAVGVGIGFGLQKVVSNFISGIIILLDKSIKPGDTISLGETFGWIRELRARFVSVVTRDGKEYLIPNEDLITEKVVNWSFSDDLIRLDVTFGVSYDANPHEVSKMAIEAAGKLDRISNKKAPVCWLTGFGDSSLDFVLRFWVTDPQNGLTNIRGKVMLALWDTFDKNNVNIPYPHREIIMKGGGDSF
jgi:small-conductance mechanosensitive channel